MDRDLGDGGKVVVVVDCSALDIRQEFLWVINSGRKRCWRHKLLFVPTADDWGSSCHTGSWHRLHIFGQTGLREESRDTFRLSSKGNVLLRVNAALVD